MSHISDAAPMKNKKKNLYLVIRYGLIDDVDPVAELEKVIALQGKAWFGKYGQPLNLQLALSVREKRENVVVVFVRKGFTSKDNGYVVNTYNLLSIGRTTPTNKAEYPEYYSKKISYISSWLELTPYAGREIKLATLVTQSSQRPLSESLAKSMRGHFLCRDSWERNQE
jgi:hypothetical protein